MGGLSWWHWLIILSVFILLFGAKKLPEAARGVGRSLRILKSEVGAMHEDDDRAKQAATETDYSASVPTPTAQITGPTAPGSPTGPPPTATSAVPVVNGVPVDERRT